jgi:hypothetical protein
MERKERRERKKERKKVRHKNILSLFEVNIINHIDEEKRVSPSLPSKQRMKFT